MKIFAFRSNKCHLRNRTNQPLVTSKNMRGIKFVLKFDILSEMVARSEIIRNPA